MIPERTNKKINPMGIISLVAGVVAVLGFMFF
jgi:hypothetical protein